MGFGLRRRDGIRIFGNDGCVGYVGLGRLSAFCNKISHTVWPDDWHLVPSTSVVPSPCLVNSYDRRLAVSEFHPLLDVVVSVAEGVVPATLSCQAATRSDALSSHLSAYASAIR